MKRLLVMLILGGMLMFAACKPNLEDTVEVIDPPSTEADTPTGDEPVPGGTLVFSFGAGTPLHFNPALLSGSATVIPGAQIFASPLRFDAHWNPRPYLAKSWDISDDGLSVTLHLVENATFHDGEPITSSDVSFSVMTVKKYHPFKTMFDSVTTVETPDAHTAIIHLSQPHPAILMAMSPAFLPILPEHVYGDGQDILTHPANLEPIGSGPFKFVSFDPGKRLILERYEDYFLPGQPYLDRIEFWIDLDPDSQVVSLERQVAHMSSPFSDFNGLEKLGRLDFLELTQQGYEGIGAINWLAFNLLNEPLSDKRVRQAIAYAIDLDFISRYLHHGLSQRTNSPIIPESPFFNPDLPDYAYDPQKSAELLDQAGYPLRENGTRFSLTLDYIPVLPSQQHDVAYYIQSQLKEVGIDVWVRDSDTFPVWAQRIGNWNFDMTMDAVFNWGDPLIGVHRTYISENIRQGVVWSNTQNYRNPRVDEILEQAGQEMDFDKRKKLYDEFQQIVADELPVLWMNVLPNHTIYHRGLGNPPLSIWGVHSPLDEVYWQNPPEIEYIVPPVLDENVSYDPVILAGNQAIQFLQNMDFYSAREKLALANDEFLDLEGSGLHVFGFTREGTIFLDNSNQFQTGMDIGPLIDMQGDLLLPILVGLAEQGQTETIIIDGVWPHPATQVLDSAVIWCGKLTQDDIICSLSFELPTEAAP